MCDLVVDVACLTKTPSIERIFDLERELRKMPPLEIKITHHFSKGTYAREAFVPKGTIVTGKIHREEHLNIVSQGDITVWTEDGMRRIQAPYTFQSKPGTKRVAYAHTDTIWTTIHATTETDLELLEEQLIVPPPFDALVFRDLTAKVIKAEKPGFWSDWTPEQQALYNSGNWRKFSEARGYTAFEIADFADWMRMVATAKEGGINPYECIQDLATQAAIANLATDARGEILKSSHLPLDADRIDVAGVIGN